MYVCTPTRVLISSGAAQCFAESSTGTGAGGGHRASAGSKPLNPEFSYKGRSLPHANTALHGSWRPVRLGKQAVLLRPRTCLHGATASREDKPQRAPFLRQHVPISLPKRHELFLGTLSCNTLVFRCENEGMCVCI